MRAVLVDPSLFTGPYDAALSEGLARAGVQPLWMTRPCRRGERMEIPAGHVDAFYYRRTDESRALPKWLRPAAKGMAHLAGTLVLLWKVRRSAPDVVHIQWVVVPLLDCLALLLIRRWCPLVLTMHDTAPWNAGSWLQRLGHRLPAKLAHRVIVHTRSGLGSLVAGGVPEARIRVIAHGPLAIPGAARPMMARRDARWSVVLFGELKPYKGLDVLVDAVAAIPVPLRARLRVIVAGTPRMDLTPIAERISALGLGQQVELRPRRLSEEEMGELFAGADAFVFPYRHIDASGVYHLVKPLGKWMIASRVGVFAEDLAPGAGALVPPGDAAALARALAHAIQHRPCGVPSRPREGWGEIGRATRALYEDARAEFAR